MRVSVCSTRAKPSAVTSKSAGARFPKISRGEDSQCEALCSSPNTATAGAITGTRLATTVDDVMTHSDCVLALIAAAGN